jgi:hypothetical protein
MKRCRTVSFCVAVAILLSVLSCKSESPTAPRSDLTWASASAKATGPVLLDSNTGSATGDSASAVPAAGVPFRQSGQRAS